MAWEVARSPFISTVPITASTSTATALQSYGVVTLAGSSAAKTWTIKAPVKGREVFVVCLDAATGAVQKLTSSGVDFASTDGAKTTLSFNHDYENVTLVGANSTRFYVKARGAITSS